MGRDVEGALKVLLVAVRHASDLNLVGLVHQAFKLQQTFPERTPLYSLEVLLEFALDIPLETRHLCFLRFADRTASH